MLPGKVSVVPTIQLSPRKSKRGRGAVDAEDSGEPIAGSSTSTANTSATGPKQLSIDEQIQSAEIETPNREFIEADLQFLI
jgi:hypothetical protein